MLLEDYMDVIMWSVGQVPDPNRWIDNIRHHADAESIRAMLKW